VGGKDFQGKVISLLLVGLVANLSYNARIFTRSTDDCVACAFVQCGIPLNSLVDPEQEMR
jgi:hypothetical protein